jgi:hypothetical protein
MKKNIVIIATILFCLLSGTGRAQAEQFFYGCFQGKRMLTTEHIVDTGSGPQKTPPVEGAPCEGGGTWKLLFQGNMTLNRTTIQEVKEILGTALPKLDPKGMTVRPWTKNPDWKSQGRDERMTEKEVRDLIENLQKECRQAYPAGRGFNTLHDAEIVHAARLVFRPPVGLTEDEQDAYVANMAAFIKAVSLAEVGDDQNEENKKKHPERTGNDTCQVSDALAGGFLQVIPATSFDHCSGANLLIPRFGIQCGAKEIARYATMSKVGGSLGLVMAAYNMGYYKLQGRGMVPFEDTVAYTKKILAAWAWFREHGLNSEPKLR